MANLNKIKTPYFSKQEKRLCFDRFCGAIEDILKKYARKNRK
jgi:hypothetical protein